MKNLQHLIVVGNHYDLEEMEKFVNEFPGIRIDYRDEKD